MRYRTTFGHAYTHARASLALLTVAAAATLLIGCAAGAQAPASSTTSGVAASSATATRYPLTVTDSASRTVTFDAAPQRIVSLAPANTEILYSLGVFDRLVGVTTYDDYPAQVKDVAKMGDFVNPNLEAIAAADPDAVFVTGGVQADTLGKLEQLGVPVMVIDPQDLDGVFDAVTTVARVVGIPEKGAAVVKGMQAQLAEIRSKIGAAEPVPTFIEVGWNPLYTAGPGTLLDDLLTQAGGSNVVSAPGYVSYSVEELVQQAPAVYLGTLSSIGEAKTLAKRPGYSDIPAIRDGRVHTLDDNLVSRPGPRVVEGVREIAMALHPDAFK